jgi:cytochrome c-type biogenesis protein CcmH
MRALLAALLLALSLGPAFAVEPEEMLDDPALEARARDISKELRCLVCQNQSIDDSNAGLARDLRVLVRERLTAGDSNEEAMRYIVDRYGDFVLLRPPVRPGTYALWFGPALLFAVAGLGLLVYFRRRRTALAGAAPPPLTEDERARLEKLMDEDPKP